MAVASIGVRLCTKSQNPTHGRGCVKSRKGIPHTAVCGWVQIPSTADSPDLFLRASRVGFLLRPRVVDRIGTIHTLPCVGFISAPPNRAWLLFKIRFYKHVTPPERKASLIGCG